jgi:hypothetical protein
MSSTELHVENMNAVVERGLEMADDTLFVINPTGEVIEEFVTTASKQDDTPPVRLFVEERTLKDVLDDFLVASRLADLTEQATIAVRALPDVPRTSLLLTEETLLTIVESSDSIAGLPSTNEAFITDIYDHHSRRWKRADPFSLRTPPLSRVRETMAEEIGEQAVEDFDVVLETLDSARSREGLDEVTITLLVAANNSELLYDISRWGEDISLASKATFSRAKKDLEDAGLLDTEKVPIEVGRPRLRLVLGNAELRDADIETVVEEAQLRL